MKLRKCFICDNEFVYKTNQKYCSKKCKSKGLDLKKKDYYKKMEQVSEKTCNSCDLVLDKSFFYPKSMTCKKCLSLKNKNTYHKRYKEINEKDKFIIVTEFLYELKWKKRFYMGLNDVFKAIDIYLYLDRTNKDIEYCEDVYFMMQKILDWWLKRKEKFIKIAIDLEKKWLLKKAEHSNNQDLLKCKVCGLEKDRSDFRHIKRTNKITKKEYIQILGYCKNCESEKQRLLRLKSKLKKYEKIHKK
jgi:hypothetical protein